MRDIFEAVDPQGFLSHPDPVRRAQIQMKTPLPKRFYNDVAILPGVRGFVVGLDGKPAKTPGRDALELPTEAAAGLVAAEFAAQVDIINPVTMPTMRLANTAIDGVAREIDAVVEDILRFASSDLVCYRSDAPAGLVARQNAAWDGVINWARDSVGARMSLAEGIVHVAQPRESIAALGMHVRQRCEPFRLAALHLMTSLTGSALLALAVEAAHLDVDSAWTAAHVDEDWQIEHWGDDSEAMARRAQRRRDMLAAAALIEALDRP